MSQPLRQLTHTINNINEPSQSPTKHINVDSTTQKHHSSSLEHYKNKDIQKQTEKQTPPQTRNNISVQYDAQFPNQSKNNEQSLIIDKQPAEVYYTLGFQELRQYLYLGEDLINKKYLLKNQQINLVKIQEILQLSTQSIDFKQCLPRTIHQRPVTLALLQDIQEPIIITMKIRIDDPELQQLPQYIFGLRRPTDYEYYDQFKFKANRKGHYEFILGIKTPTYKDYLIQAKLQINTDITYNKYYINLSQRVCIPQIICTKQLYKQSNRILKFIIFPNRYRKEYKVSFRYENDMNIILIPQIIPQDKIVQIKPKIISLKNKGQLFISFVFNSNQVIDEILKSNNKGYTVCKVLIFKVKDTQIYYHFPMQITYMPRNNKQSND